MPIHTTGFVSRHTLDHPDEKAPPTPSTLEYEHVLKYNPNHDPHSGKFTSGGGGRRGGTMGTPREDAFGQALGRRGRPGALTVPKQFVLSEEEKHKNYKTMFGKSPQGAATAGKIVGGKATPANVAGNVPQNMATRYIPGLSKTSIADSILAKPGGLSPQTIGEALKTKPTYEAEKPATRMGEAASTSEQHEAASGFHAERAQRYLERAARTTHPFMKGSYTRQAAVHQRAAAAHTSAMGGNLAAVHTAREFSKQAHNTDFPEITDAASAHVKRQTHPSFQSTSGQKHVLNPAKTTFRI